jgi:hypothetical protein
VPPRSALDHLRFQNQTSVVAISPRRQALLDSTRIKRSKELLEWIEFEHPNGIEMLDRISRCPTDYSSLIQRTVAELRIVEPRANELLQREFTEFRARRDDTESSIVQLETAIYAARDEKESLLEELSTAKAYSLALQSDVQRLQNLLSSKQDSSPRPQPHARLSSAPTIIASDIAVQLYTIERERLEGTLEQLEQRLLALTREHAALVRHSS